MHLAWRASILLEGESCHSPVAEQIGLSMCTATTYTQDGSCAFTVDSEQGLVDSTAPTTQQPKLTLDDTSADVSQSRTFTADPPQMLFTDFEPGKVYTERVRVVNTAERAARLHVLPSAEAAFKHVLREKRGAIAAGLAQDVFIEFRPDARRRYQSMLRLHYGVSVLSAGRCCGPVAGSLQRHMPHAQSCTQFLTTPAQLQHSVPTYPADIRCRRKRWRCPL